MIKFFDILQEIKLYTGGKKIENNGDPEDIAKQIFIRLKPFYPKIKIGKSIWSPFLNLYGLNVIGKFSIDINTTNPAVPENFRIVSFSIVDGKFKRRNFKYPENLVKFAIDNKKNIDEQFKEYKERHGEGYPGLLEIKSIPPGPLSTPRLNKILEDKEFIDDLIWNMGYERYWYQDVKHLYEHYSDPNSDEKYILNDDELRELMIYIDENYEVEEHSGGESSDEHGEDTDEDEDLDEIKSIPKIPKITYGNEKEGLYGPHGEMTIEGLGTFAAEPTYPGNGTYTVLKINLYNSTSHPLKNPDKVWHTLKLIGEPAEWTIDEFGNTKKMEDVLEIPQSYVTVV